MTPRLPRPLALLLLLLCAALACQVSASETPTPKPGQVLFQDEFSDPLSGWNRVSAADGLTDYADGVYRILVNRPNLDIWSKPGLEFSDVRVEVDSFKVSQERNNRFGLICRALDATHFYTFMISSDGYYAVGKVMDEQYALVDMSYMQPSEFIRLGSDLNHLRADCIGEALTFYVNGHKLISVHDDEYMFGDVGLIAGTYDTAGTDVRFDNLTVQAP